MIEDMKYSLRGVSANKSEVHAAIRDLDKGLFPKAFCKVLPDIAAGDPDFCNIMHADTAGTKTSLGYIYWKETGDLNVWKGIVQDAIVMNIDDLACVGATDKIVLSSTIGRNKNIIPGEVVSALISGTSEFLEKLNRLGADMILAGGETADVGDIVRTVDVGFTAFTRMPRAHVIENNIQPGDVIVGLASYGQATYENEYNSGIGSNGLTSARHDVLSKSIAEKYPESYNPAIPSEFTYSGQLSLNDKHEGTGLTIGQLLLSPTRTYLPVIRKIISDHQKEDIHGIIHCTGGGQTKVMHFIDDLHIIKNNLFPVPPVFQIIQEQSGTGWKEMYQVFNMGHRLEFYVPEKIADSIIEIAGSFNIEARIIGKCEAGQGKKVTVESPDGKFIYES